MEAQKIKEEGQGVRKHGGKWKRNKKMKREQDLCEAGD